MEQKSGGGVSLWNAETYRKAIKITFPMNGKTPNEILFLETGLTELKAEIYKRQYVFWEKVLKDKNNDPNSNIPSLFKMAINKNVHFIRNSQNIFDNVQECYKFHTHLSKWTNNFYFISIASD